MSAGRVRFPDAATRHVRDARTLLLASPANARYLAGYTVECALKTVVEIAPIKSREYGHDLMRLAGEGLTLATSLAPAAARYQPNASDVKVVRDRWAEHFRYHTSAGTTPTLAKVVLEAAERIYKATIVSMILDGLLEMDCDGHIL